MSFITWGRRGDLAGDRDAIDEPLAAWEQLGYRDDVKAARAFSAAIPGHVQITQDGRVIARYVDGVAQPLIAQESTMPPLSEEQELAQAIADLEEAFADTGLAGLFDSALNEQNPWHDAEGKFTDELDALIYSLKGKFKRLGAIRRAWNKVRKYGRKLKSAIVGECDFTESLVECEIRRQLVSEARPELSPDLEDRIRKEFPPPGPGHVFEPGTEEDWFGAVARVVDQDLKRGVAMPGYTPEGKKNYGAFVNVYRNVRKKHSGAVPFEGRDLRWYVAFEGKPKPAMSARRVMEIAMLARVDAERLDYRAGYPKTGMAQLRVYGSTKNSALVRGARFDEVADQVFSEYEMSPARAGTDIAESTAPGARVAAIYERLGLTK